MFHFGVRVGCYGRMSIVWYDKLGVRLLCMWRRRRFHDGLLFLVLLGCLHWILHPLRGSILPRVFTCWIYLVGSAPVWQQCLAAILVWKYLYMERDETTRRVSSRHFALLMQRYPKFLPRSAIRGHQWALPSNIALLGAQNLARVGPIDLVNAGWPC
jgi:hypothetical protein